jgi:hypothetical protein
MIPPPVMITPPVGCREELLYPLDLGMMIAVACSMFHGKVFVPLGFSHQREFIGGRAMLGVDQGPTPPGGVARGWPAPPYGADTL